MPDIFLGEINIYSLRYAPMNYTQCDGQKLKINQNNSLYNLIGLQFGGGGRTTFALPDLRGRVPLQPRYRRNQGEMGGSEITQLQLKIEDIPHSHKLRAGDDSGTYPKSPSPSGNMLCPTDARDLAYAKQGHYINLSEDAISFTGESEAISNMQPFLALNFCIALRGITPSVS